MVSLEELKAKPFAYAVKCTSPEQAYRLEEALYQVVENSWRQLKHHFNGLPIFWVWCNNGHKDVGWDSDWEMIAASKPTIFNFEELDLKEIRIREVNGKIIITE